MGRRRAFRFLTCDAKGKRSLRGGCLDIDIMTLLKKILNKTRCQSDELEVCSSVYIIENPLLIWRRRYEFLKLHIIVTLYLILYLNVNKVNDLVQVLTMELFECS